MRSICPVCGKMSEGEGRPLVRIPCPDCEARHHIWGTGDVDFKADFEAPELVELDVVGGETVIYLSREEVRSLRDALDRWLQEGEE